MKLSTRLAPAGRKEGGARLAAAPLGALACAALALLQLAGLAPTPCEAQLSLFADKLPGFVDFKKLYGKIYASPQEDARRERIFNRTLTKIDKHNRLFNEGRATYALYPCEYSDMDEQEVATFLKGIILPDDIPDPEEYARSLNASSGGPTRGRRQAAGKELLPDTVDFRTTGCLSLPKDQKFW